MRNLQFKFLIQIIIYKWLSSINPLIFILLWISRG